MPFLLPANKALSSHLPLFLFAVDMPTDIEMSKVVADLEYVLADNCGSGDDADVNVDDSVTCCRNALIKV